MRNQVLFPCAVLVVYAGLVLFGALHHEPWRDEAQIWLVARDLSIPDIFRNASYEGSPVLWYLLNVPLAKAGLPYWSQKALHLCIAVAGAGVFLFFAPFPRLLKVCAVFSFLLAYEYAVISRSYSLSVFLLFSAAALEEKKFKRPLLYGAVLFCLANTNAHSLIPALALGLLFLSDTFRAENSHWTARTAAAVALLGVLVAVLQLITPEDSWNAQSAGPPAFRILPVALGNAFFSPGELVSMPPSGEGIAMVALLVILLGIAGSRRSLWYAAASFAWLSYVFVFVYPGVQRHHGFFLIHCIVALWIGWREAPPALPRRTALAALFFSLAVSLPHTGLAYANDYRYLFSGAGEMAAFVQEHYAAPRIIVAHRPPPGTALLPYLAGRKFWYADRESFGTYYRFDWHWKVQSYIPNAEALERAERAFPRLEGVLVLLSSGLPAEIQKQYGLRLVRKTEGQVIGHGREMYWLYEAEGVCPDQRL